MIKKLIDLQLFTDGGEGNTNTPTLTGQGNSNQHNAGQGSNHQNNIRQGIYSFEQAEQIAEARADRATKAALSDYFKQQGMTEQEITTALADFKAKKAAAQPNITALEKQRDEALTKLTELENINYLRDKGVKAEDLDYVLFKVNKQVDDKTDFKKATETFLKDNPRFIGQGYKVVSTGKADGGSGTTQNPHESINAALRSAFGW